ncbi:7-cyano-7-deazaguanine synthase QueC [Pleionea mediterranea]|uniref:7-cyano-7-deazaguanine synthase n=1 Tax=Pleionea mediterranea TaxID=523701 RepID=A0A316G2U2_9GAMM|nr:7-cyano-7-deazaguanine synthase QueC [Pleionea mediterranea]PWK54226.1 preQ(0) biosynthesis protein QueC [Pleionea mediterranea]
MKKAIVLLSGGLDSTTCLAIAKDAGYACYGLSFSYGQRHSAELEAAKRIAKQANVASHRIIPIDLGGFGGSALTDDNIDVPESEADGIPVTYVPARNTVFLSIGLAWAEVLQADAIYAGVNAVDYSGYPDCRPEYIDAFQKMADLATKAGIEGQGAKLETPLIDKTKVEIIQWGNRLSVDYSKTVSCYQADSNGRACGRCDSCRIRAEAFKQAKLPDPTVYID